jgi:hypothetical protein
LGLVCAIAACSSQDGASLGKSPPTASLGYSPYTLKILRAAKDGTNTEMDFVPQEVANAARSGGSAHGTGSLRESALIAAPTGSGVNNAGLHALDNSAATGATKVVADPNEIVQAAAAECGMIGDFVSTVPPGQIAQPGSSFLNDPYLQDVINQEQNGQHIPYATYATPWTPPEGSTTSPYYIFNNETFNGNAFGWGSTFNSSATLRIGAPHTCDEVLEAEEALVCIADKLSQVADTVGPITFHTPEFAFNLCGSLGNCSVGLIQDTGDWIIPPQADASKFIVRDLAINILAHVPMVDAFSGQNFGNPAPFTTCAQGYNLYANGNTSIAQALFGTTTPDSSNFDTSNVPALYPPFPTSDTGGRTLAQERQAFEAGVLRTAGQLLHDLIRESVYSDLAGAANNAGAAADPVQGQQQATNTDGSNPYNSLGHIARTLLGRWEMDPAEPDPQCYKLPSTGQGVKELDLLPKLADVGTLSRAKDLGAVTSTQAKAEALLEKSGIVLPDDATLSCPSASSSGSSSGASTGTSSGLACALTAQLIGIDAARTGIDVPTFTASTPGRAVTKLVATLSDADLARAVQHNRTTFSLLTGSPTNVSAAQLQTAATNARLTPSGVTNSVLNGVGIAIDGGLLRAKVVSDSVARTGPMAIGSQCFEGKGLAVVQGDDQVPGVGEVAPNETITTPVTMPPTYYRQDVFAIGQAIRARLVKLREFADQPGTNPATTTDAKARGAAVAEIGAWAGAGRMILSTDLGDFFTTTASPTNFYLDLLGVEAADFGVSGVTNIPKQISLVYGDATLAECAANLRPCDGTQLANATWLNTGSAAVTGPLPVSDGHTLRSRFGMTDQQVRLVFPMASGPLAGQNLGVQDNFFGLKPLYVVAAQDPTQAPGVGAVLGALKVPVRGFIVSNEFIPFLETQYGETSLTLSPMRRELLYDAFGLGKWVGAAPPHAGEIPVDGSPNLCGQVPRDMFVPLQNDLTDSSDAYENSWQHYLSLAQEAATNADTIGQQLIDIGLQRDVNIENAADQVLTETGNPLNVDDLSIGPDGNIIPGPSNGALAQILNQPVFDAVFFGADPARADTDPTKQSQDLQNALQCNLNPSTSACTKLQQAGTNLVDVPLANVGSMTAANKPGSFTWTALNLAPPPKSDSTYVPQCTPLVTGAKQMKAGVSAAFNGATFASAAAPLNPDTIVAGIGQTAMTIDDNPTPGHWQVTFAGVPIMDSDITGQANLGSGNTWPACLAPPMGLTPAASCAFAHSPTNQALNDMFRSCPPGQEQSPLGACENNNADAELNAIRWRVEGALWLAAAMSGDIGIGMFSGPTPAVNFNSTSAKNNPDSVAAPVNTFFGNGAFATQTPAMGLPLATFSGLFGPVDSGEFNALQPNSSFPPVAPGGTSRYFNWGTNGAQQVPNWLLALYSPGNVHPPGASLPFTTGDDPQTPGGPRIVHVFASTPEGASDFSNLNGFFSQSSVNVSGISNQIAPVAWAALANLMDGGQCPSPTGDGNFGHSELGDGWLQGLVASLKTQQATSSEMRKPFFHGESDFTFWGLWGTSYRWNGSAFESYAVEDIPSVPRNQWFDQVPVRYHWYDVSDDFSCIQQCTHYHHDDVWSPDGHALSIDERNPSKITPGMRLRYALNSGAPQGNCDAAWQLTQAMALSCVLGVDVPHMLPPQTTLPPKLTSYNDLVQLTAYLKTQLDQSAQQLQTAFVTQVPAIVVANAMNVPGTLSSAAGQVGKDLAQASNSLLQVYTDWQNVQSHGETIANAIDSMRIAIAEANTQANETELQDAIQKEQVLRTLADDVAKVATGIGNIVSGVANIFAGGASLMGGVVGQGVGQLTEGASAAISGGFDINYDNNELQLIGQLQQDNNDFLQEQINQAITNLNEQVNGAGTAMSGAFTAVRQDINNIQAGASSLATDRTAASYYAGKASGADAWNCKSTSGATVECGSHVNTVLNRRYDGTQIRYQAALQNAKGLAYLARLSIEQRLGIRMTDLTSPIGTLEAPSTWANSVCSLSGVNYQMLRGTLGSDAGTPAQINAADQQVASEFADAFIGDYVQKLTDFVTYYNVAYPEQDGNDTAVLSLRESLIGGKASCRGPSVNLLVDSSRLYDIQDASKQTPTGWVRNACAASDSNCLQPRQLGGLGSLPAEAGPGLQLPTVPGGATWLLDAPPLTEPPNPDGSVANLGDAGFANLGTIAGGPDNVESQQVTLSAAGTYVLSWWDQAIDPATGQATSTPQATYQAGVYDSAWTPVAAFTGKPSTNGWSARQTITFTTTAPDVYHVVFGASISNSAPGSVAMAGSVAIANVQLELATSSGGPTAYVDTDSSGQATQYACTVSPADMRAAFVHNCDADGTCHYDLTTPITIDTQTMTANGRSLAGKLATGNYNFRHIDVAVNVVGTGVIDCSSTGSPDCFGSGYLQYGLTDDGSTAGVLGFDGQYRVFDFGIATIDHSKAITAERYITTPIGSADQSLIGQFQAVQFRGRPIDGTYQLRIYDTPALRFGQIQDIQLILSYHYWSRVTTANSSN